MGSVNKVFLMGNLTRDPELRKTPSGSAVANMGIAVSERFRNKQGELVKSACFVDVIVWEKMAENCSRYLRKGSPVLIEGRLKLEQWETPQGEKRSRLRVLAGSVQFLGNGHKPGERDNEMGQISSEESLCVKEE